MKIILGICSRFNDLLNLEKTLKNMGHEVYVWNTDNYLTRCSYIDKKIYKLGYKSFFLKNSIYINQELYTLIEKYEINNVLLININSEYLSTLDIKKIQKKSKLSIWYVDNIDFDKEKEYIALCNNVYMFAPEDVFKAHTMGYTHVKYCPVGYNMIFKPAEKKIYEYDISFVGSTTKERRELLEIVAKYADKKGYRTCIVGELFPKRLVWKNVPAMIKYPHLLKRIDKAYAYPSEVYDIYNKTKICLNIHHSWTEGLNPRTFDILATKSFQLLNKRNRYENLLSPGEDIVEYHDTEDIIGLIDYYLENEKEREKIAENGYKKVYEKLSMEKMIEKVLNLY